MLTLSPKQEEYFARSTSFINLAEGAVRGGKTHINLYRFAEHALTAPPGDMMVLGKTQDTVYRNVVAPLLQLAKGEDFDVRCNRGTRELHIGSRLIHVVGANDVSAQEKVQGSTLAGALCNEVTLYPEGTWQTLIDRHSVEGARIFADCNPDSPFHWLYKDYMHGEAVLPEDMLSLHFEIDDNPSLDPAYKERLFRLHPPGTLWHKRMVLGLWVAAEGAIYDMLDLEPGGDHVVKEIPDNFERVVVGVDYGTSNPTVYLAAGKHGKHWTVFSEYRYDPKGGGKQRSDGEHSRAYRDWIRSLGIRVSSAQIDPSAASFKVQLRDDGVTHLQDADNAVVDGIRVVSEGLTSDVLKIHESCEGLLSEMSTYTWDPKKQEIGEDAPIKEADHGPDALRYLCMRALRQPALKVLSAASQGF